MPGVPDYTTENFYSYALPTTQQAHCTVFKTEISEILIDSGSNDLASRAAFFHDESSCGLLCNSIDIDPCYVEKRI